MLKIGLFLIGLFAAVIPALGAEKVQTTEARLVRRLEEVQKYSSYGSNYDGAKLSAANESFEKLLLRETKKPETLKYAFEKLGKMMFIRTSEDKRFRVYSWNTEDGGTMRNFSKIIQYRAADGKVHSETYGENEGGDFVHDIFTIATARGRIYLVSSTGIISTQDQYSQVKAFQIKAKKLDDKVNIIRTKAGLTGKIGFAYNFFPSLIEKNAPLN